MKPFIFCIILSGFFSDSLCAGELNPPGPPAPTMKSLSDVEPRTAIRQVDIPLTISTSGGSYYLAEPISMLQAGNCITISNNDVTVDLNGYSMTGNRDLTGHGIFAETTSTNTTVKNGNVRGFRWSGITLQHEAAVINVKSSDNGWSGISTGKDSLIENCTAVRNSSDGFSVNGIIRNCIAAENTLSGIYVNSVSLSNTANIVSGNTCSNNLQNGIFIQGNDAALVTGNTCKGNVQIGIASSAADRVEKNHLAHNDIGILLGDNAIAVGNTATSNGIDYVFNPGSTYGPIMIKLSGEITSTNPWANISF